MRFEFNLAKKYIVAQKRHSILTICSIAIALILITVMFVGFITVNQILLDASYDSMPYHMLIPNVTQEQANIIAQQPEIQSCTIRDAVTFKDEGSTEALLFFTHDVKNINAARRNAMDAAKIEKDIFRVNLTAITLEGLGDDAKMEMLIASVGYWIFVLFILLALRLIIDTAFEISSRERERQFGVLQSVGATPRQIVRIITHEGFLLSCVGIPLGIGMGIGVAYLVYRLALSTGIAVNFWGAEKAARVVGFHVTPKALLITALCGLSWVFFSAYGTGMRIIKMSPMEAIRGKNNRIKKSKKHRLAGLLFGWLGKFSAKNIRRQPKRFFITVLSLTVSITLYSTFSFVIGDLKISAQAIMYDMTGTAWDYDMNFNVPVEKHTVFSYQEPMKKLESSGYFKKITPGEMSFTLKYPISDTEAHTAHVVYYPKEAYDAFFEGNPPVSYEKLAQKNQYILRKGYDFHESFDGQLVFKDKSPQSTDIVHGSMNDMIEITQEEYLQHEKQQESEEGETDKGYYRLMGKDSDTYDEFTRYFKRMETTEKYPYSFPIAAVFDPLAEYNEKIVAAKQFSYSEVLLIGTLEQFEKQEYQKYQYNFFTYLFGRNEYVSFSCSLKDPEQHESAVQFLKNEMSVNIDDELDFMDLFGQNQKMRSALSAIEIGLGAIIILLALVAIINMINIISTSLLNRKSEFAALQSFGMSHKQLLKLTFLEAFEYVLIATVFAIVLCEGIVYPTNLFMAYLTLEAPSAMTYFIFLPRLGIAAAVALVVAFIATFIPMQRMKNDSIVENIRGIE